MSDKCFTQIKLRAVEPSDADFMYEAENDPDAWRYSDYLAPLSKEILHQYALTYDADPLRAGQLRMIIDLRGKAIGIVDLFDISAKHLRGDTGIYILPDYRSKRYAREALLKLEEYARVRLGLHQLTASIAKTNHVAVRTYENAGYVLTGIRKDWLRKSDGFEDVLLYSIIIV